MNQPAAQRHEDAAAYLARTFDLERVRPVREELFDRSSGNWYFEGYAGGERVFVKWGGKGEGCRHEYEIGRRLHALAPENFIRPRFYRCGEAEGRKIRCVGFDYLESETLQDRLQSGALNDAGKERVIRELVGIGRTLLEAGCAHRDINPVNVVVTEDGRVLLVDLQFAAQASPYAEQPDILANPRYIHFLGTGYFKGHAGSPGRFKFGPDRFQWDDMYSLLVLLDYIGCSETYRTVWEEARNFFQANLGKLAVEFPGRERLLRRRKLFRLLSSPIPVKKWRDKIRMRYLLLK